MKKSRIIFQVIVGVIIIAFIFYKIDMDEVISILKKANLFYFLIACLSYLLLNITLAARLNYLLSRIGHRIKLLSVFFSHMGGMIAGDITPGRSGYFLTPSLLKKKTGTARTDGLACIFAPQGLEFVLKVGGAIAALFYISSRSSISNNLLISIILGASVLMIGGILMLVISWKNESRSLRFLSKIPYINKFTENLSSFKERSIQIKESINVILILYLIGWFFAGLPWFYLGKALGIELSFFAFFLLHPLITILMFIPVSPAGIGLMEGGAILVFSLFGILPATAMAFSVLVRVSILLIDLIGLKSVLSSLGDLKS